MSYLGGHYMKTHIEFLREHIITAVSRVTDIRFLYVVYKLLIEDQQTETLYSADSQTEKNNNKQQ